MNNILWPLPQGVAQDRCQFEMTSQTSDNLLQMFRMWMEKILQLNVFQCNADCWIQCQPLRRDHFETLQDVQSLWSKRELERVTFVSSQSVSCSFRDAVYLRLSDLSDRFGETEITEITAFSVCDSLM